jgi:antitoxin VapB
MTNTRVAKIFKNGASQAVRLPADFRFSGNEVYATRDEITGDITLSDKPGAKVWREFFEMARSFDVPENFMSERPMNRPPSGRDVFADEK